MVVLLCEHFVKTPISRLYQKQKAPENRHTGGGQTPIEVPNNDTPNIQQSSF